VCPDQTVEVGCGEQSDIWHEFGNLTHMSSTALKEAIGYDESNPPDDLVSLIHKIFRFFFNMLLLM
jgi:hypothetical protein